MMRIEEKIFGDRKFKTHKLPASEAILLKMELIHLLGGALGSLSSLFKENTEEFDLDNLGDVLSNTVKDIEPVKVSNMIQQLCSYCFVDGKKMRFDEMFAEVPMTEIYKVAGWVLEVNFSDFFGGKGLLSLAEKKVTGLQKETNK